MSPSRTEEILDEWRAVAHAAMLPAEAPRPSRSALPFGVAGTAVVVVVLIVALAGRGNDTNPGGPAGGAFGSGSATAPSSSIPSASVSPTQTPSSEQTCSAGQFVLGKTTSAYGFATAGMMSVYVTQPIRNGGGGCLLLLPGRIRVASVNGLFQTVKVLNTGAASSFSVRSGQSLKIVLGAWWRIPGLPPGTGLPATACTGAISDVSRVEIPLASGSIQIDLGTVWHEICSSPATVSLTVTN